MIDSIPKCFTNSAGRYRLAAIEGDRVRYHFESRRGAITEADVPVIIWKAMAEKSRLKEAA